MVNLGDFFISKNGNGLSHNYYCICQLTKTYKSKTVSFPQKYKDLSKFPSVSMNCLNNFSITSSNYVEEISLTDPNFMEAISSHIIREDSKEELNQFITNLVHNFIKEGK